MMVSNMALRPLSGFRAGWEAPGWRASPDVPRNLLTGPAARGTGLKGGPGCYTDTLAAFAAGGKGGSLAALSFALTRRAAMATGSPRGCYVERTFGIAHRGLVFGCYAAGVGGIVPAPKGQRQPITHCDADGFVYIATAATAAGDWAEFERLRKFFESEAAELCPQAQFLLFNGSG